MCGQLFAAVAKCAQSLDEGLGLRRAVGASADHLRIAVISNMVDPNVIPIYERLAERGDCSLLVLFETEVEPNRRWTAPSIGFDHVFLKSHTIDLRRIHPDAFLHLTWGTRSALAKFKPDIVVGRGSGIWSSPANISAYRGRNRYGWLFVPWWESFGRSKPTLPRRLADRWIRRFLRNSDAILACGTRASNYLESIGIKPGKIHIAPHAVPAVPTTHDVEAIVDAGVAREIKRVLFVGQLLPRKGIDVLLAAISKLRNAELWVAGDGDLRDEVLTAAAQDSEIRFLGHLPKHEVMELYPQIDVLVVPSRYEVWGLVVDEAQAYGRPSVVTDQVGCANDLIKPGVTGEIVSAGDADQLAQAIESVSGWSKDQLMRCAHEAASIAKPRGVGAAVDAYFSLGHDQRSID